MDVCFTSETIRQADESKIFLSIARRARYTFHRLSEFCLETPPRHSDGKRDETEGRGCLSVGLLSLLASNGSQVKRYSANQHSNERKHVTHAHVAAATAAGAALTPEAGPPGGPGTQQTDRDTANPAAGRRGTGTASLPFALLIRSDRIFYRADRCHNHVECRTISLLFLQR